MARTLLTIPKRVKKGEIFEVKILISHVMETGQRRDNVGQIIPRDIIHSFSCTYNGELVMKAELFPAISANPFLSFDVVAEASGTIMLTWTDDKGTIQAEQAEILVE
jgi:sulfur-oxidizing protein SoxZ